MNRRRSGAFVGLSCAVVLSAASQVMAQDATVGVGAQTTVPPQPAPPPPTASGGDHDMFVGHWAVGWYGEKAVPVGPAAPPAMGVPTPVVGVRYWLSPMLGIDAGLGLGIASGSTTTTPPGTSFDTPSATTFVIHGGVPLALASSGHFTFEVTPEVDIGFGSGTTPMVAPAPNVDLSGFMLQVGGRAGGEVYFGFIGLPQLSLDASVGLFLRSASGKATQGAGSQKLSTLTINTTQVNQPWDIFRTTLAVHYYF